MDWLDLDPPPLDLDPRPTFVVFTLTKHDRHRYVLDPVKTWLGLTDPDQPPAAPMREVDR